MLIHLNNCLSKILCRRRGIRLSVYRWDQCSLLILLVAEDWTCFSKSLGCQSRNFLSEFFGKNRIFIPQKPDMIPLTFIEINIKLNSLEYIVCYLVKHNALYFIVLKFPVLMLIIIIAPYCLLSFLLNLNNDSLTGICRTST